MIELQEDLLRVSWKLLTTKVVSMTATKDNRQEEQWTKMSKIQIFYSHVLFFLCGLISLN